MPFRVRFALLSGILLVLCSLAAPNPSAAQSPKSPVPPAKSASGKPTASKPGSASAASAKAAIAKSGFSTQQLETLSRALKGKTPAPAYARLSAIALQKSSGVLGMRAALALGYFDYTKAHYPQAAAWFARAKGDPLLAEYALYWTAETNLTQGRDADLFDRSIDLLVSRLRQRLGDDAREPSYIKTVRSEGYVFSVPVEIAELRP